MDAEDLLAQCTGFEWDEHNVDKNWLTHHVAFWECEEVFFNEPIIAAKDTEHSPAERRFYVLGRTNARRRLFVVFTIREKLIRVISARDMTRREKAVYENYKA